MCIGEQRSLCSRRKRSGQGYRQAVPGKGDEKPMPLELIYITNNPAVARIAEENGVERVMVDLEILGKEERQKHLNSVKSYHSIQDIHAVAEALTRSEMLVRINPWHEHSVEEIEHSISAGAQSIMLPMWKSEAEVDAFLRTVNKRVRTTLLLETKEAVECLDAVLEHPLLDDIHIGLNDLHLSYGLTFMFELLSNGTVERLCKICRNRGVKYGFGGIAKLSKGLVPAENVIMEHYRLGSSGAILSRTFCNAEEIGDLAVVAKVFREQMGLVRGFEESLAEKTAEDFAENQAAVARYVQDAVAILEKRKADLCP